MKARKLCREAILNTPYAKSVQTVERLITDIIETSDHLKNLEVSADLPKSKQKSQAKSFLQQKRKALADLFRALQEIGLSYRTGLVYWNAGEVGTREFVLPPVDLRAAFQHLKSRYAHCPADSSSNSTVLSRKLNTKKLIMPWNSVCLACSVYPVIYVCSIRIFLASCCGPTRHLNTMFGQTSCQD